MARRTYFRKLSHFHPVFMYIFRETAFFRCHLPYLASGVSLLSIEYYSRSTANILGHSFQYEKLNKIIITFEAKYSRLNIVN